MTWQDKTVGYGRCQDYIDGEWIDNPDDVWVEWKKPPDLDWSNGYSSLATEGDCEAAEAELLEMFPGAKRCLHEGYTPESLWPEETA